MKYVIRYEHIKDELVTSTKTEWHFDKVRDNANNYSLELSDEDFKHFLKLQTAGIDIRWLMHKMSAYKVSFTEALVVYTTF